MITIAKNTPTYFLISAGTLTTKRFIFCLAFLIFITLQPSFKLFVEVYAQPADAFKPFTVVVLPDTQGYLHWIEPDKKRVFQSQIEWIQDHALDKNILMVLHLGDIVMTNNMQEWKGAKELFQSLDNWIPYVLTIGNHDASPNTHCRGTELFNLFFPVKHFINQKYFGGVFEQEKLDNAFYFFKGGMTDYLVIALEFAPRDEALEWANKIIENYPNHKVFIITHAYLGPNDIRLTGGEPFNLHYDQTITTQPYWTFNDGEEIWEKLVRRHKNVQFVLSGHVLSDGVGRNISRGDNGNNVFQIVSNYQFLANGGNGYMRIMEFYPKTNKLQIKTYSPYLDYYKTDKQNEFVIDLSKGLYQNDLLSNFYYQDVLE